MSRKNYQLLIFDWDGTLMDSAAKIVACLRASSATAQLPLRTDAEYRYIIGLGMQQALNHLYPDGLSPAASQRFINTYRQQFLRHNQTPSTLFPGVRPMLEQLRALGYHTAIATGKSRAGLDRLLGELELHDYFDISRCADETCSKPDPMMLHAILTDLNMSPEQALMIGDTSFDVQMAQRATMDAVAIAQGTHSLTELQDTAPTAILQRITELSDWLDEASATSATISL